jgi:hypothetical protein
LGCEDKEEHLFCCLPEVFGCTDSNAENYNESATDDDESCEYLPD